MKGILIPPAFGVTGTPSQKGTGPGISVQHRLLQASVNQPVGYLEYLQETDLSSCLLRDHMQPGFWCAAQAAANTIVRVGVASDKSSLVNSQLFIERKLADQSSGKVNAAIQLRAETALGSLPSISGSWQFSSTASLFASVNGAGNGWLGGHMDRTFRIETIHESLPTLNLPHQNRQPNESNDTSRSEAATNPYEGMDTMSRNTVNYKLGVWMPINWKDPANNDPCRKQSIHGYAAVNMLGATAAVHASMPIDSSYRLPVTSSYFSANLNDVDRPPLQITLERCNNDMAAISLSQVLAFDRWQWNPIEDRAPKVRNNVALTIRMESSLDSSSLSSALAEDSGAHTNNSINSQLARSNRVVLGAAWQINRGVAVKAVLHPQEQRLTTAMILKRWKHPRIACSLINSFENNGATSFFKFLGVGIELETGLLETNPDAYYYIHHPSPATSVVPDCDGVPKTRAALPSELSKM